MVMFARQMGQPRARLYTSSAQDEQKCRCPHGTRAMLLSREATKQTSQSSPVMLRPLRYCDTSSLLRFFISRLFRSHHFHPCTLVPRFPLSRFPFSPFQRPRWTLDWRLDRLDWLWRTGNVVTDLLKFNGDMTTLTLSGVDLAWRRA